MEKDFVKYEEALALKELGFKEPCFFAFDNCSTPMRCSDLRTNKHKFNGVNYNNSSYVSQPTYSQAFRFFREKYGVLAPFVTGSEEKGYAYMYSKGGIVQQGLITNPYKTYEEAELACLKQLIKINK